MKDTLEEAEIKERVNDWLAAFSAGNKPFNFSVLDNLYWQDEQLLAFETSHRRPLEFKDGNPMRKSGSPSWQQ